jgi:hypothetical protein
MQRILEQRRHPLHARYAGTVIESQPRDHRIGLCATCEHMRSVESDRGSIFYRCALAEIDPRFPKYPRLPVIVCDGFSPRTHDGTKE